MSMKEMPEGWKRLEDKVSQRDGIASWNMDSVEDALNLMKEMAEALEQQAGFIQMIRQKYRNDFDVNSNLELKPGEKVLKKFREWK